MNEIAHKHGHLMRRLREGEINEDDDGQPVFVTMGTIRDLISRVWSIGPDDDPRLYFIALSGNWNNGSSTIEAEQMAAIRQTDDG